MSHDQPRFLNLKGEFEQTTWEEVFDSVRKIQEYFKAISRRFVERESVLQQLMFAIMLREHIMVDGPTGTAKTKLVRTVFSDIRGAAVWMMDLTQYTTETHLFGTYDIRAMRETGQMVHMTEGSLAEANFAQTGEFFDANDGALRALLGALNERVVRRGPQVITLPLVTCIADTNFHPEELPPQRRQKLAAVIDRFLFRVPVEYVRDPKNRLSMLEMSLEGVYNEPIPSLHLSDIVRVSGVVRGMNLVQDPYLREAYQDMTLKFNLKLEAAKQSWISDRRFVLGAHIMEVSALLQGRKFATFEDLEDTQYILTHSDTEKQMMEEARRTAIETWVAKANRREIETELKQLADLTRLIPENPNLTPLTHAELKRLREQLETNMHELHAFDPKAVEVGKKLTETIQQVYELTNRTDLRMIEVLMANMPVIPENAPGEQLPALIQQVNMTQTHLKGIKPLSEEAIIKHTQAMQLVLQAKANLEVQFKCLQGK